MTLSAVQLAIQLLIAIESGGNPKALNTHEDAVGVLQIRPVMVADVNRILALEGRHRHFTLEDRWNPESSREMATIYLGYYGSPKRLGYEPNLRDYALLWCAGPDGPFQEETPHIRAYLAKVEKLNPHHAVAKK